MIPVNVQLAELTQRESVVLEWLGKDVSEVARRALEEDLRRLREQRRELALRQIQGGADD